MTFILQSSAFKENGLIPSQYTCDGANISPELSWQNAPENTKSFVLIMDDPDAPVGVWDHWLLFNIPPTVTALSANLTSLPSGIQAGKNSWGKSSYGGPCPPDREHRYVFKLYALDATLNLANPNKSQLEAAIQGHTLATTTLIGRYNRKRK